MEALTQPKILKVYILLKQNGMAFSTAGAGAAMGAGPGFYLSREEAEYNRTIAVLGDNSAQSLSRSQFHIFELEVPNPAHPNFGKSTVDL